MEIQTRTFPEGNTHVDAGVLADTVRLFGYEVRRANEDVWPCGITPAQRALALEEMLQVRIPAMSETRRKVFEVHGAQAVSKGIQQMSAGSLLACLSDAGWRSEKGFDDALLHKGLLGAPQASPGQCSVKEMRDWVMTNCADVEKKGTGTYHITCGTMCSRNKEGLLYEIEWLSRHCLAPDRALWSGLINDAVGYASEAELLIRAEREGLDGFYWVALVDDNEEKPAVLLAASRGRGGRWWQPKAS